ncbi:hypothetical protein MJL30_38640, partial [Salmonella enterica subsp. enterica serovar Anatum]|nr:hypothetical protein [Salmonella enterica subsp. enterica serovar Anatum]
AGELVAVLEEWEPRREVIHAVFPSRRGLLPSVRALVDFLTEDFFVRLYVGYSAMNSLPAQS